MSRTSNSIVILFLASFLFAENKDLRQKADAIWKKAEELSTLNTDAQPYGEQAIFILYTKSGQVKGMYTKEFADADDWIEEVKVENYQRLLIHKEGKIYEHENSDFTPLGVSYLLSSLPPPKFVAQKNESVRKISSMQVNGIDASCVESDIPLGPLIQNAKRAFCVSATDRTLLSSSLFDQTTTYSGYALFQDKLLPAHVQFFQRQQKMLEADLSYQGQPLLKAASIQVPAGLNPQPQCKTTFPPELRKRSEPRMPSGVDIHGLNRIVVLRVLIGADGRVSKSALLESAGPDFDKAAEEAVRKWTFTPSLCDGSPIETKADVEVSFRGYE